VALTPADRDLIRRDPALPGLATLLDPEAFAAALAPHLSGAEPVTAHGGYIRYKPGTNCLASYQLETMEATVRVYAKAHGPDSAEKLQKARHKPGVPGLLGAGRLVLEEEKMVVSFFPNDTKLKVLSRLAEPEARRGILEKLLPQAPELWEGSLQTLRYKPERRYVARLLAGGESRVTLKAYTPEDYRAAETNAGAFEPGGALRLARRLGRSARHGIVAFEWRPGLSLRTALSNPGLAAGSVRTAGAALAALHRQDGRGLSSPHPELELDALTRVLREIQTTAPHLGDLADQLAQRLAPGLSSGPSEPRPIHGDFYDEQVLLDGDAATILDLDRAVLGEPAADLGLFIAHLERDSLLVELARGRASQLADALLEGYEAAGGRVEAARVGLYTAYGLLKLSPEPFRHRDPKWPESTRTILEHARDLTLARPAPALKR